ncbi:MAG: 4Fe-4S dicluster domain-containing protein [Desulfobacterales bacterium]|nr:4Fe-4S dicluster domain-containing protein [Desulfobacterales bacterium]
MKAKTPRWVMVIDLRKCIGCRACAVVCSEKNNVPSDSLRKVVDCDVLSPGDPRRGFLPLSCMHCDHPPCLAVCPTGATYRRPDGIVNIDEERCLGCGYCEMACPYHARTIFHEKIDLIISAMKSAAGSSEYPRQIGVSMKCNFCLPKVESGMARELKPGVDPDATPECVLACSGSVLHFGDLNDPQSNVSQLLKEHQAIRLQTALGTEPSIFYIPVG